MLDISKMKHIGLFAGGVLFGTAGVKVLASKDAKKLYINCLAAGLRAKESVMTTATNIQENAGDICVSALISYVIIRNRSVISSSKN